MVLRNTHRHARRQRRNDSHIGPKLVNPRLVDHALGLELQLVDVVEQTARARVQGSFDQAASLEREIDRLQAELAETAARVAAGV